MSQLSLRFDEVMSALQQASRPCVLLRGGEGNSKIGGLPDGMPAKEWPTLDGAPLSFLAQIELAEVRQANGPDWLPSEGQLLFFYDTQHQPWGFDPTDRGGWRVIYQTTGKSDLPSPDIPGDAIFPEKRLCAIASKSLPEASSERIEIDLQGLSDAEFDLIYDAKEQPYEGLPSHQIGGFANPIQGDHMELEAQLASNGIYCGDSSGYEHPRAKALEAGVKDWVLLLQLDSDDDADMMWGDSGILYFWIREQDARRGDFSNVWMILQCC